MFGHGIKSASKRRSSSFALANGGRCSLQPACSTSFRPSLALAAFNDRQFTSTRCDDQIDKAKIK
jgi:hypothetical protein